MTKANPVGLIASHNSLIDLKLLCIDDFSMYWFLLRLIPHSRMSEQVNVLITKLFPKRKQEFLKVERIRLAQWVDYNDHGQINNVPINWMFIITKRTLEYTKKKIVFWQRRLFRQLLTSMLESIRKIWLCFVEEHCFTNAPFNIIGISELVCINEDINSTFEL